MKRMHTDCIIIGGGIIGLEMASVYATLGTEVDIVEPRI